MLALRSIAAPRFPSCLSCLTQLRSLEVSGGAFNHLDAVGGEAEAVALALPRLRQLTHLALSHPHLAVSPTALINLTQLSSLEWNVPLQPDAALPPGNWLAQLTMLNAPWDLVRKGGGLPALSGRAQLKELTLTHGALSAEEVHAILSWAMQQPRLHELALEAVCPDDDSPVWHVFYAMPARNPPLFVSGRDSENEFTLVL